MKRFYEAVSVVADDSGYAIMLDGRPVRSPGREALVLPTRALAESVAEEWRAQSGEIAPESMSMTRFANSAIDRVMPRKAEVVEEISAYAETDLLCYRTDSPPELADRQAASWQPLLDWAAGRYGAKLHVTTSVTPIDQDGTTLEIFRQEVAARDAFGLSGLHSLTTASGSIVIALAVAEGHIGAEEATAASLLDETFQAEKWGEDSEAVARWESISAEIAAAARYMLVL